MNDPAAPGALTQEQLNASTGSIPAAAVEAAQTKPSPTDPFEAFMQRMDASMTQVQQMLGISEPLVNEAAAVGGVLLPTPIAPVLERLPAIEGAVNGIIAALSSAFADHPTIPARLPAPLGSPPPASSAA
jgi:hypothetical protein